MLPTETHQVRCFRSVARSMRAASVDPRLSRRCLTVAATTHRPSLLHGFTLIELMVTVSIVALLAAILLPAIMQSRAAARRTVCQSNQRQWTFAVRMYADVHQGRLPYRGQGIQPTTRLDAMDDWFNAIPQFMENPPYVDLART